MSRLKTNRIERIPRDTIFCLHSLIDGSFYATVTAKPDDGEPIILIAGPFATEEEAKAHNGECLELAQRTGRLLPVDRRSVPAAARRPIAEDVLRGWRQGDFERLRSWRGGDDRVINLSPKN
jgi:hypothetical protein